MAMEVTKDELLQTITSAINAQALKNISKDEIFAFTEANKNQALALNSVGEALLGVSEKLDKILDQLSTRLKEEIVSNVVGTGDEKTNLNMVGKVVSEIRQNMRDAKLFISMAGVVIVVATVITNVLVGQLDLKKLENIQAQKIAEIIRESK